MTVCNRQLTGNRKPPLVVMASNHTLPSSYKWICLCSVITCVFTQRHGMINIKSLPLRGGEADKDGACIVLPVNAVSNDIIRHFKSEIQSLCRGLYRDLCSTTQQLLLLPLPSTWRSQSWWDTCGLGGEGWCLGASRPEQWAVNTDGENCTTMCVVHYPSYWDFQFVQGPLFSFVISLVIIFIITCNINPFSFFLFEDWWLFFTLETLPL